MPDTVASRVIFDGPRQAVIQFTNVSDGTGEAAGVVKVTPASLAGAPTRVHIDRIVVSTAVVGLDILWTATTDDLAWHIAPNVTEDVQFDGPDGIGGLRNPESAGVTGTIKFRTVGTSTVAARYSVVMHMTKSA